MNHRQDPYGQIYGYDEYGRPLYRPAPDQPAPGYDPYAGGHAAPPAYGAEGADTPGHGTPRYDQPGYDQRGYDAGGYDGSGYAQTGYHTPGQGTPAYGAGGYDPAAGQGGQAPGGSGTGAYPYPDGYAGANPGGYAADPWAATDPYAAQGPGTAPDHGYGHATGVQPSAYDYGTGQQPAAGPGPGPERAPAPTAPPPPRRDVSAPRPSDDRDYRTEQFSFVEEDSEASEDVINWLEFTESRTERREEAKRRGRGRRKLLALALVLALLGGSGYLWATDRLPFLPGPDAQAQAGAADAQSRDVIIVHLRETGGDTTATALLVADTEGGQATTLLLPNDLLVTPDGGITTLGLAVTEEGAASVRDAVGTLLGAQIKGTWRLDTPYLEILVDLVGGVTVASEVEVPAGQEDDAPLVTVGEQQLKGRAAVAYSVYRAADEPAGAQLERFGQVMAAVLEQLPSGEAAATETVKKLTQIADPSLPEEELGASLAQLAGYAQDGAHSVARLPVTEDGTVSQETADGLVADVLGGTVTNSEPGATPRIAIRNAGGGEDAGESARIALVNGGFTVVGQLPAEEDLEVTEVRYTEETHRGTAVQVALTLGLPEESVVEGAVPGSADVAAFLGTDYGAGGGGEDGGGE